MKSREKRVELLQLERELCRVIVGGQQGLREGIVG